MTLVKIVQPDASPSPAAPRWRNLASLTQARRPPSNRPTPEFERRHDVEAAQVDSTQFRPGWRVQSRFDAQLRDGCISPAEYDAGEAWSRDYHAAAERSVRLVSSFDLRMDGSHCSAEPTQRRLDAIRRQRELAVALGPVRIRILESMLIFDISWRGLAQQLQLGGSRTANSEVVDAVRALHAFQSGTAVPPYRSCHRGRHQIRARV